MSKPDRTATERQARRSERLRKAGMIRLPTTWLHPHEKAALDTLTADGQTVRDAVGGAIVRATMSPTDMNRLRQWFNAVQDLSPAYLEPADYALAVRIHEALGVAAPARVVQAAQDKDTEK